MTLRARTGTARKHGSEPLVAVMPFNELPAGVASLSQACDSDNARRLRSEIAAARAALPPRLGLDGKVDRGYLSALARIGGLKRALRYEEALLAARGATRLAELAAELLPGLDVADPAFKDGLPKALEFITIEMAELGSMVGGGQCPNGPSSMVVSSALQLLASRVKFARGEFKEASSLADASAQNIARAHEYTAKLAVSRAAVAAPTRWLRPKPEEPKP